LPHPFPVEPLEKIPSFLDPEDADPLVLRRPIYRRLQVAALLALGGGVAVSLALLSLFLGRALLPHLTAWVWGMVGTALLLGYRVVRPRASDLAAEDEWASGMVLRRLSSVLSIAPWISDDEGRILREEDGWSKPQGATSPEERVRLSGKTIP
jgi:hypothetical protein